MNTIINELNRDWERILNDNPNNEYFRNIVMDFLKPDLIDSEKFTNNLELIHAEYYFEIEKILRKNKLTTTMSYYSNLENRPSGFPDWFLAAYPDVSKWFSKNIDSIEKIPLFKNIFDKSENFIQDGTIKNEVLRVMIDYFIENIYYNLECNPG
ncbi:MAG TPA: hypothetical protein PK301_03405 [Chitinophagales bacterium]|nr:hypothetical protein [Chitinophagales bacterium]